MKRKAKKIVRKIFLGLCLITMLLTNSIGIYAAQGSVTIHLKDGKGAGVAKVGFQIYKVGSASEDANTPVFDSSYGIENYPETAEALAAAITVLQEKITTEPLRTEATDENGKLTFKNLENGLYFVTAVSDNSYGEVMPFLVTLPYYKEVNGALSGPLYEIEIEPKSEPHKEPGNPDKPSGSTDPSDNFVDSEDNTACPTTLIKAKDSIKTGDTAKIGLYLCVAVSSLLLVMGIMIKKRGGEKVEK